MSGRRIEAVRRVAMVIVCLAGWGGCARSGGAGEGPGMSSPPGALSGVTTAPTTPAVAVTGMGAGAGAEQGVYDQELEARLRVPPGWRLDPPKRTSQHVHKTWISPSGDTAYGVIRFSLPIPLTRDLALWGFLREMRRKEGEATLLEKTDDPRAGVMRFVAEGGKYKVRTKLVVRGFKGWAVYAGSLKARGENPAEMPTAEAARDTTGLGGG